MNKLIRKFKRSNRFAKIIYFLVSIIYLVGFIFFAKSVISLTGIETFIRYLILILFLLYLIIYVYVNFVKLAQRKYGLFILGTFISLIFIGIFSCGSVVIDFFYDKIAAVNEKDTVVYTSYLVGKTDTTLSSKSIIGMISNENDPEGYIIAKDIIKKYKLKQEIVSYDDYLKMLYDLYDGTIDALFITSNYITLYSSEEGLENIASETKVIYQLSKKLKNADNEIVSNKSLTEPFTFLIMGVDSEKDGLNANAAFNGDTLILATFNPNTYNTTLLSIPRDTYVPIACRKGVNYKINSSAAYGTNCVIETITALTDINIDYYVKINFKGVVELVEAVGGVDVDVEEPNYQINHGHDCKGYICEQDSNRDWGSSTIYIKPGYQTLNGEQALAYARNRGQYAASDLARNRHQQDIIMALAQKVMKLNSYSKFKGLLDSISNNISTNMSTNQILSTYKIFKGMVSNMMNDEEVISIQKSYLETYSLPVYNPSSGRTASALGYYEDSLNDIKNVMKINLGLEDAKLIKTFNFSLDEAYEPYVAGKGLRTGTTAKTMKNLINSTKEEAQSYCDEEGLNCTFTYIDSNSQYYDENIEADKIAYQTPNPNGFLNTNDATFYIIGAE